MNYTVQGPILFSATGKFGNRTVEITLPQGCEAELVVPANEDIKNLLAIGQPVNGLKKYRLVTGQTNKFLLKTV